jgi:signal transduction histidine kinase
MTARFAPPPRGSRGVAARQLLPLAVAGLVLAASLGTTYVLWRRAALAMLSLGTADAPWTTLLRPVAGVEPTALSGDPPAVARIGVAASFLLALLAGMLARARARSLGAACSLRGEATDRVDRSAREDSSAVTEPNGPQPPHVESDRLASVGALVARIAHEINNPLTCTLSSLELLSERICSLSTRFPGLPWDELREPLGDAREGSARVKCLVRDLTTFSCPDRERRRPVDLVPALESSIRLATHEIRQRARVVTDFRWAPTVVASEGRLGQVFLNLLVNAAQAIPRGNADEHEIRVIVRADDRGWAVVEIRDTGRGMPQHVLDQVFDPFFTTKLAGAGHGLGLSISRDIVATLGGEIELDSRDGHGTTCRVALPAAPGSGGDAAPTTAPSPPRTRAGRR